MTDRIKTRPQANLDLEDCFTYTAGNNEDAALRFFDAVRQTLADLARMPGKGKFYHHSSKTGVRLHQWQVKGFRAYLIFYQIHTDEIDIVRILPASRNIDQILKDEII
jgi:toxin ParE1/3/4